MNNRHVSGYVIKDTTIAVDFWVRNNTTQISHSFLTHAHVEHTNGLDSSWENGIIYCTKVSKYKVFFILIIIC